MALVLLDRAKETTTVVGTGTATLLGAVTSYQSLAGVGNGNTTYYCIVDQVGANWEVGIGTYTSAGTTLARTTVLASSNAGALVVFTTGVKDVFVTYPSEKGVWYDASGNVLFTGTTTAANISYTGTLTGGTGVVAIGTNQIYKDASGNVGIGSSTSSVKLYVRANLTGGTSNSIRLLDDGAAATSTSNNSYGYGFNATTGELSSTAGNGGFHSWYTANTERMRIDSSGNVGIGTTAFPSATKLVVQGESSTNPTTFWSYGYIGNGAVDTKCGTIRNGFDGNAGFGTYWTSFRGANGSSYQARFGVRVNSTDTDVVTLDSSGNLLVGCTSVPNVGVAGQYGFSVAPTEVVISKNVNTCALYIRNVGGGAAVAATFYNGTSQVGSITTSTTATAFNTGSDIRLKENIIDAPSALASVNAIKVRSFDWKVDGTHQDYGYIAQELLEVVPEAVSVPTNEDEMMGVDFGKLTPRLVKAIQELKAIIDTQQEQINSLLGK